MLRKAVLAASLSTALASGVNAQEQRQVPVRIGIIDTSVDKPMMSDRNIEVTYREFTRDGYEPARWEVAAKVDHGVLIATAACEQIREIDRDIPIQIYAANAFDRPPGERNRMELNEKGAIDALHWFKENNVKVVLTTFVGGDTQSMRSFSAEADRLGLVVFASGGNQMEPGQRAFPAAYRETIGVGAINRGMPLSRDASQAQWVDFGLDGKVTSVSLNGAVDDVGSSMATARAAGMGAYMVLKGYAHDRESIKSGMKYVSRDWELSRGSHDKERVTISFIDHRFMDKAMARLEERRLAQETSSQNRVADIATADPDDASTKKKAAQMAQFAAAQMGQGL